MKTIKNFIILFFGDGISYLLNFITTIYLARILEVNNFGKINFAFAFFSFGSFLTNLGLVSIATREIAQRSGSSFLEFSNYYVINIILLRQILAIIVFIILSIITILINKSMEVKTLIILYGLSLFPFALLLEWLFLGIEEMTIITLSKVILALSYLLLILFFVKTQKQLTRIPIAFFVSYLLSAIFFIISYLNKINVSKIQWNFSFQFKTWKELLTNAMPVGIGAILLQFSFNFNIIFLGLVRNSSDVGLFSAANKILMFILIFDRVMNNTIFPTIARYYSTGKEKLSVFLNKLNKLIFVVALPICAGVFFLAKELTVFIYGCNYEQSYRILRILIWFFLFTMLNSIYTSTLIAGRKNKEYISTISCGVIVNVFLILIFTHYFGARGVAISLVISELIIFILLRWRIKPIVEIKFSLINISKTIIATLLMIIFINFFVTKLNFFILIILAALLYFILIILIQAIRKNDLSLS